MSVRFNCDGCGVALASESLHHGCIETAGPTVHAGHHRACFELCAECAEDFKFYCDPRKWPRERRPQQPAVRNGQCA